MRNRSALFVCVLITGFAGCASDGGSFSAGVMIEPGQKHNPAAYDEEIQRLAEVMQTSTQPEEEAPPPEGRNGNGAGEYDILSASVDLGSTAESAWTTADRQLEEPIRLIMLGTDPVAGGRTLQTLLRLVNENNRRMGSVERESNPFDKLHELEEALAPKLGLLAATRSGLMALKAKAESATETRVLSWLIEELGMTEAFLRDIGKDVRYLATATESERPGAKFLRGAGEFLRNVGFTYASDGRLISFQGGRGGPHCDLGGLAVSVIRHRRHCHGWTQRIERCFSRGFSARVTHVSDHGHLTDVSFRVRR